MNRLILIRGPICAGKSTTASCLQNALGRCSLIDQDCLKRAIDRKEPSDWRDNIAFDTTLYLTNLLMARGRDIIADIHSSIPRQYDEYKKLALKHGYKLFSFLLYPPLQTCLERNLKRVIPDVQYKTSDSDIKKYWENVYTVKDEQMFDTSIMKTDDLVQKMLEIIEKSPA